MISRQINNSSKQNTFRDITSANRSVGGTVGTKPKKQTAPSTAVASQTENSVLSLSRDSSLLPSKRPPFTTTNTSSYQYTGKVDNIDERDAGDPLCATEYVQDMYEYFRNEEVSTSVRPMYMEKHPHINERMRSILVDWLVEVHLKFKLVPQTLYLAVNLIDRYLERKEVSRSKLQLVGVTSLFIASKYEEIYPAPLREHVFICDHVYTSNEILGMQHEILETLKYQVRVPTAHTFLVRFLKAGHADKKIVQLACYILDGTLESYKLNQYLPSQLAAGAIFIARRTVGLNP